MMKSIKNQTGQTLLEVVVTIGVAMIIIGSLVALINASTRRSTLARQATQASRLTQEGMEIVRNIRDVNASGAVQTGKKSATVSCTSAAACKFEELYNVGAIQGNLTAYLHPPDPTAPAPVCNVDSWCLVGSPEATLLGIFSRSVVISDQPPVGVPICSDLNLPATQTKKVTVTVSWQSPIGSQERSATTCLTRNPYEK